MRLILVILALAFPSLASARGLVFVHPSGRVAYQAKPGVGKPVLFERGYEPSLSPDERQIAFRGSRSGEIDRSAPIVIVDVDTRQRRIWREGNLRAPRFSPDGAQLVFSEMVEGRWATLVAPVAHPERARVVSADIKVSVFEAVWLPDGSGVLVHDLGHVYWLGLDGTIRRQLALALGSSANRVLPCPSDADCLVYDHGADSSPALSRALERSGGERGNAVFLRVLSTGTSRRLTSKEVLAFAPAWDPTGDRIYFVAERLPNSRSRVLRRGVWSMQADGTGERPIVDGSEPGP